MAARETPGLRYLSQLQLGYDEMQWLQDERNQRQRFHALGSAWEPGWVGSWLPHGQSTMGWALSDPSSNGILRSQTGVGGQAASMWHRRADSTPLLGVAPNGLILELTSEDNQLLDDGAGAPITVPDDGVWYTLVAVPTVTTKAPGTLAFTGGSATVIGSRTDFTRYGEASDPRATKLRVDVADSTAGNEGIYEILTITDEVTMTVTPTPPATESGVQYRAKGVFFSGDPADPDIHNRVQVTWELRARTVTPPTDALIAYDVMRDSGVQPAAFLIDRRHTNVYRRLDLDHQRRWYLSPTHRQTSSVGVGSPSAYDLEKERLTVQAQTVSEPCQWIAAAPAAVGADMAPGTILGTDHTTGMIAVIVKQAVLPDFDIECVEYVPFGNPSDSSMWRDPDGGAPVFVATAVAGTCVGLACAALPLDTGNTHVVTASSDTTGTVLQYLSTDNGATWSAAATIWNPNTFNAGDAISGGLTLCLTRMGRLILAGAYLRNATTEAEIRYVYSDDYGATWNTNGHEGYLIIATAAAIDFRQPHMVEDDAGNLWTAYEGNDTTIRLVRGAAVNDPEPDAAEIPVDGWRVDLTVVATRVYQRPQLLACPDGQLLLMFLDRSTGSGSCSVRCNLLSRGRIAHSSVLAAIADTEAIATTPAMAVVQDAGGFVHVLWEDLVGVTPDTRVRAERWMCVPMQRPSAQWFGGR